MNGATTNGAASRRMPRREGRQSRKHSSSPRRVTVAQIGATALFLVLGSVGSFLLGVEVAARPLSAVVGSANGASDGNNSQVLQADGSLGAASNSARRSTGNHIKVGGVGSKNGHGQGGQRAGSQGQSSDQSPPPTAPGAGSGTGTGSGTSGTPSADSGSPGTTPPPGSSDGSMPGTTGGTSGSVPGTGAPDGSGSLTADSGPPAAG